MSTTLVRVCSSDADRAHGQWFTLKGDGPLAKHISRDGRDKKPTGLFQNSGDQANGEDIKKRRRADLGDQKQIGCGRRPPLRTWLHAVLGRESKK